MPWVVNIYCNRCGEPFKVTSRTRQRRLCSACADGDPHNLRESEYEIIKLVRLGLPDKEIAKATGHTYGTVKQYLSHIYTVLGCSNRTQLSLLAADLIRQHDIEQCALEGYQVI